MDSSPSSSIAQRGHVEDRAYPSSPTPATQPRPKPQPGAPRSNTPMYATGDGGGDSSANNILIDSIIAEINGDRGESGSINTTSTGGASTSPGRGADTRFESLEQRKYGGDGASPAGENSSQPLNPPPEEHRPAKYEPNDNNNNNNMEIAGIPGRSSSGGISSRANGEDTEKQLLGNCYESRFWLSILKALRDPIVVGLVVALVSSPRVQRRIADILPVIIGGDTVYSTLARVMVGIVTFILVRRLM